MYAIEACKAIADARQILCPKAPLISTMTGMHAFDNLDVVNDYRLDSVPLMGGSSGLGLGIALAQPKTTVIVVDGDASLLMELSSLVTVANAKPAHFVHFLMHNNTQFTSIVNFPTVATEPDCDFIGMAKNAGYQHVHEITNIEQLIAQLPQILTQGGATFVDLRVVSPPARVSATEPQPLLTEFQFARMGEGVARLREAFTPQ
jgi:thiamine pyrophosphate-dependent acetolactate synthase large subunit-like protein